MSIPPLLSRSPPPICETSDDDDEAFGTFVTSTELTVDVIQGGDLLEDYVKNPVVKKCEDTTSEDSGLCMSSVGQNQSPCDTSPVSSTYIQTVATGVESTSKKEHIINHNVVDETLDKDFFCKSERLSVASPDFKELAEAEKDISSLSDPKEFSENSLQTDQFKEYTKESLVHINGSKNVSNVQEMKTGVFVCTDVGTDSNSFNIPKFASDICDLSSFTPAESITFLESDNVDFDDFQTFQCVPTKDEVCDNVEKSNNVIEKQYSNNSEGSSGSSSEVNIGSHQNVTISENPCSSSSVQASESSHNKFENDSLNDLPPEGEDSTQSSNQPLKVHKHYEIESATVSDITPTFTLDPNGVNVKLDEPTNIEDDDFSDFADFQSSFDLAGSSKSHKHEEVVWTQFWPECITAPILPVHLSIELENNSIWHKLKHLDTSPALQYQWSSSVSNRILLSALNIDARNIFLGPWNKYKFSTAEGFSSEGGSGNVSTHELTETTSFKDPVPDPHFDWVGSGLVNPLDCTQDGKETSGSSDSKKNSGTSKAANEILQNLPDLSFMRKEFIVFPKCAT